MADLTSSSGSLVVTVNRRGVIEDLSTNWLAGLDDNIKADLDPGKLLGQPLSLFIRNDSTKMYVESCLQLCRVSQKVLVRTYRCDSPTHKRFMELELTPLPGGAVKMTHSLLGEEAFIHRLDITEQPVNSSDKVTAIVRCSFCNKLRLMGETQWLEPENLVKSKPKNLSVIHSVCPACTQTSWTKKT